MRMRMAQTQRPGPPSAGMPPPTSGAAQLGQQARPGQPQPERPKPWTLYLKSKIKSCSEAFGFIANNAALRDAMEIVNVSQEKPPAWLQGVPCLVERNLKTGQQRAHNGTAALNALAWLSKNYKAESSNSFQSAGAGGFGNFDTFDAPLDASGQGACQINGGCPLGDAFEYQKEYMDGRRVTETDMHSLLEARQKQEAQRGNAPPPQVSFLEPETNKMPSMDELMRLRMQSDAQAMARGQRQL